MKKNISEEYQKKMKNERDRGGGVSGRAGLVLALFKRSQGRVTLDALGSAQRAKTRVS